MKLNWNYVGSIFFAVFLIVIITFTVGDNLLHSMTGDDYTTERWFAAEEDYCSARSMTAKKYVGQSCGLFGCVDRDKVKCVDGFNELKIDYSNPIFCKYSLKNDLGMCD